MPWHIHPFMKNSGNAHFPFDNHVQRKVVFNRVTATARIPIFARLAQSGIGRQLLQATVEPGGIRVHLPLAPSLKGILKNIREIEGGELRKNNGQFSP